MQLYTDLETELFLQLITHSFKHKLITRDLAKQQFTEKLYKKFDSWLRSCEIYCLEIQ